MKCTEDTNSVVPRNNTHQLESVGNKTEALNTDYDNSILEGLTSSDHTDWQEDELFEQFNTHISKPNNPQSAFSTAYPTSLLYPNLQTIGYPTASYPTSTHELLLQNNIHNDTSHATATHSLPFSHVESPVNASHQFFPVPQYTPFQIQTGEPYFPFVCQQYLLPPIIHDPNHTHFSIQDQGSKPFLTDILINPDSAHSELSTSCPQSPQMSHVYMHNGLNSFTSHSLPFSTSDSVLSPHEYHNGSIYPSVISFQQHTQTNKALSLGKGKTILFNSKPSDKGFNLPLMPPTELSSYVLGLLDSNASIGNVTLENLQTTLSVTDVTKFENFYINVYNVVIEHLLALAKSHRGSLFIMEFAKKIRKTDLYLNLMNSLLNNTKSLMSNQHSIGLLQSLLDDLPDEQFLHFCNNIESDCMTYCYHRQANHIIQKVICILERKAFISKEYREAADKISTVILKKSSDFIALSDQVCGCRIYQKLFPLIVDEKELANIRDVLVERFVLLCNNQWANFCVQGFIQNKRLIHTSFRTAVIEQLIKNAMLLCTHKFGSHVIEAFLDSCTVKEQVDFSMRLFLDSNFPKLMDDSYGNFIVQKMLQQKESRNDARLATLRETCGRLCKYYLKSHNFREQSIKHITGYLNKSLKKIKILEPLHPEKVLDIAKGLDTSSWIFNINEE